MNAEEGNCGVTAACLQTGLINENCGVAVKNAAEGKEESMSCCGGGGGCEKGKRRGREGVCVPKEDISR